MEYEIKVGSCSAELIVESCCSVKLCPLGREQQYYFEMS